jgi:bis(5'-nucleosidyl)-tetraphosphatase
MKDESFGIVPILAREKSYLFLVVQHHAGHWGFPKGHANQGELPVEAARRELEEETGIRDYRLLDDTPLVENYTFIKGEKTVEKTVTYFLAQVSDRRISCQEAEIQNYSWASFDETLQLITFEQGKKILVEAQKRLKSLGLIAGE